MFYSDRRVIGESGCAFRAGEDSYVVVSCSEEGDEDMRPEGSSCLDGYELLLITAWWRQWTYTDESDILDVVVEAGRLSAEVLLRHLNAVSTNCGKMVTRKLVLLICSESRVNNPRFIPFISPQKCPSVVLHNRIIPKLRPLSPRAPIHRNLQHEQITCLLTSCAPNFADIYNRTRH